MPFTVVVAGVPRSGSTWLYNAVRLLSKAAGLHTKGGWIGDIDPHHVPDCDLHLIKLHDPKDLTFAYDCLLSTHRDLSERLASLTRMGWLSMETEAIRAAAEAQTQLHLYWAERSSLEVSYTDITLAPQAALKQIAECLNIGPQDAEICVVARKLADLAPPPSGNGGTYNSETLLHPGHRASHRERQIAVDLVRCALEGTQWRVDPSTKP